MLGAVDLFKAVGHETGLSPGALLSPHISYPTHPLQSDSQ